MADRVSASITVGGRILASDLADLADIVASYDLSIAWDGDPFDRHHLTAGEPIRLYGHEVAWGHFGDLEDWCRDHRLSFVRWYEACSGQWGAQRVVCGVGEPVAYPSDDGDGVLIDRPTAEALGSFEAILAYFTDGAFAPPTLVIVSDDPGPDPDPPELPTDPDRIVG